MLSPDVRVDGFDASDWIALTRLFPQRESHRGGLLVLRDGGSITKVVSTVHGRQALPDEPVPLEQLAADHGARWAVSAEPGALDAIVKRLAERLVRDDDLLDQILKAAHVLRDLSREGRLAIYPRDAHTWRIPRRGTVDRALDMLCPVGKTVLLCAYEGGEIATSIALRRGRHGIERITGPSHLRGELGLVSQDWSRNGHGLVRAVELAVGPVAFGAFALAGTWQRLVHDDAPGRWTAALAAREVVFYPVAPAVAIPLGIDLGRAALSAGWRLAQRLGHTGQASSRAALFAVERLRESGVGHDAERLLGFDPLALFAEALSLFAGER